MADPKVSIIIPCYNGEPFISETLESVQMQTFRDWEAIVVNDGSTDNSAKVIGEFCANDSRINIIEQKNQGLAGARNAGLALSKGEFVNFLDADDLLMPNMLNQMVEKLKKNKLAGAVNCGWIFTDPEVKDLSWVNFGRHEGHLFDKLAHSNPFPCHAILLRREILEKVGDFDCSLKHCHDWDLWLRVARAGVSFSCFREPLVIYRMTPGSLSRNPITFYEAEREIILRGHKSDKRVKQPKAEFSEGCKCLMQESILQRLINNVGFAIAQGDDIQASRLFERTLEEEGFNITPDKMRFMTSALWFGSGIPKGHWKSLWERISLPLLKFLIRQEETLRMQGFAMESILEIICWKEIHKKSIPETMSGRELLAELGKRIIKRLLGSQGLNLTKFF
jgi:GT2 family glycosyltransferase